MGTDTQAPAPMLRTTRTKKRTRRVTVQARSNPGRELYRNATRKRAPVGPDALTDAELLALFIPGDQAVKSLVERLGPAGLKGIHQIGHPSRLLELPGIDEGNAGRVLALYEIAARIAEGVE